MCEYYTTPTDMQITNNPNDSVAVIDFETNPWLLDPETTDDQEDFYENWNL